MRLSPDDLQQINEAVIAALDVTPLRALAVKLLADLKEAHDRLGQNPSNSSRPSSSRAPWEAVSAADTQPPSEPPTDDKTAADPAPDADAEVTAATTPPSDPSKPPAGKPGKRPGAPGFGRQVTLPVNEEISHSPDSCRLCGTPFPADAPSKGHSGRYELDVRAPTSGAPGLEVWHTKHVYQQRQCACGHWSHAEPGRSADNTDWKVDLSEWNLVGPTLVALICSLSLRQRVSRRGIKEFLADWLGVTLNISTINQCLHEAGRAVEPVVDRDILPLIRATELVHVDETGWKQGKQLLWLWVFTCATATLFTIGRRSRAMLHKILGEVFIGWLMSDGFWAYRDYDRRLRCLAHLVRKARGLEESLDETAQQFGRATLCLIKDLIGQIYEAREGPQPPPDLYQQNLAKLNAFNTLCVDHWVCPHEKTRQLAAEFSHDWDAIWAVLEFPLLPITNNEAEQALRHWVLSRRISQGTRTAQGSLAFSLLASVIETCRKRGVSPWPYLADVIRQRRKGEQAPALPEVVSAF